MYSPLSHSLLLVQKVKLNLLLTYFFTVLECQTALNRFVEIVFRNIFYTVYLLQKCISVIQLVHEKVISSRKLVTDSKSLLVEVNYTPELLLFGSEKMSLYSNMAALPGIIV